jgi:hypothetical protein
VRSGLCGLRSDTLQIARNLPRTPHFLSIVRRLSFLSMPTIRTIRTKSIFREGYRVEFIRPVGTCSYKCICSRVVQTGDGSSCSIRRHFGGGGYRGQRPCSVAIDLLKDKLQRAKDNHIVTEHFEAWGVSFCSFSNACSRGVLYEL